MVYVGAFSATSVQGEELQAVTVLSVPSVHALEPHLYAPNLNILPGDTYPTRPAKEVACEAWNAGDDK